MSRGSAKTCGASWSPARRRSAITASSSLEAAQGTQVEIQVVGRQLELRRKTGDRFLQPHQRETQRLRLFGAQGARLHPTDRLLFEQLSEKLHQGQHQLRDRALHVFRIRVPACRSELTDPLFELLTQRLDL